MKLLLDMDGVCVDFIKGICEAHRRPNPYDDPKNLGQYNMERMWDMPVEKFFEPTNSVDWWHTLDPMYDLDSIIELILKYFRPEDVCVLSKPPTHAPCAMEGKWYWCDEWLPMFPNKLFGNIKGFCAHRDAVLLDDHDFKVDIFKMDGGRGIIFPRPWNTLFDHSGELDLVEVAFQAMFIQPVANYS